MMAVLLVAMGVSAPRAAAQGLLGGLGGAGLYVGAQMGFERSEIQYDLAGFAVLSGGDERDFVGGVLAGLEFPFMNQYYLGVEAYWDGRVAEVEDFESQYRLGVNAVAGYQLARVVDLFVLAGPQWAQMRLPAASASAGGFSFSTPAVNELALGFTVGFGARYAITPNWLARAQYNYAQTETSFALNIATTGEMTSLSPDITNRSHSLTFGFSYMF